jgi:hypothetical protein
VVGEQAQASRTGDKRAINLNLRREKMSKFTELRECVKIDIENSKKFPSQINAGITMIRLQMLLELLDEDFKEDERRI